MTGRLDGDTSEQPRLRLASVTRRLTVAGDETRLLHTAVAFDKNRVDHVVIVISPPEEDAERLGPMRQRYAEAGVEVVELALELRSGRGALNALRIVRRLVRELRFRDIDVFDGRLGTPTAFGMLAAPLARVPVSGVHRVLPWHLGRSFAHPAWAGMPRPGRRSRERRRGHARRVRSLAVE